MITAMKHLTAIALFSAVLASVSCSRSTGESDVIELQRVRSGDLDVVLLSNDGTLSQDQDTMTIEFRRGDVLVDAGAVKAAATMPMGALPEMQGSVFLTPGDVPGRYLAETDLTMSGGWTLKIEWDGPAGKGAAAFDVSVE